MKVISFANTKGGSGKTTSAALLCSGLQARGYRVCLLDCDPLFPLYDWANGSEQCDVAALKIADTSRLVSQIKALRSQVDYTIIDLSGTTSIMNALSFALSDLVLVPMQGSMMDARGAIHTIELIKSVANNQRCDIKTSVVLTRVSPLVVTNAVKLATQIVANLRVPFLPIPVLERSAYRDMFSLMANLLNTNQPMISNLSKARCDIDRLTDAVSTCIATA